MCTLALTPEFTTFSSLPTHLMPLTYQRSPFFLCTPKSQTHADFATYRHSKVHEVGENRKGRSSTKRAGLQPSINRHHQYLSPLSPLSRCLDFSRILLGGANKRESKQACQGCEGMHKRVGISMVAVRQSVKVTGECAFLYTPIGTCCFRYYTFKKGPCLHYCSLLAVPRCPISVRAFLKFSHVEPAGYFIRTSSCSFLHATIKPCAYFLISAMSYSALTVVSLSPSVLKSF